MKIATNSLFFLGTLAVSSFFSPPTLGATELAKINGTVITLEDFNKRYQENSKYFPFRAPTRQAVLEDMIKRELAVQEAKKMGLDRDPVVIDRMQSVLYHSLVEKKLGKEFEAISVTTAEAKEYYQKNPEIRTSHVFVSVAPGANAEADRKALARIKAVYEDHIRPGKMSFAEVAQRFSEGTAAPMGGDIDYQTKDRLDPKYYDEAVRLRTPGQVSGIVRSQYGYHVIKLTAIRPWSETDQPRIKQLLIEERRQQILDKYLGQLRQGAKVSVQSSLIKN
ncbi:peptidylprolyl isomerase [bacterium]|jgi:peptidyl-prolyl cis-trans isomerase C/peptidyl-prolyl cis-trans isomerase D|nr:peptidylprolyl isomerase [bacterium]